VNEADARAGQHGDDLFRNLRQVNRDSVAFSETQRFECVGATIDLTQQFRIGEDAFLAVLADPYDCDLVAAPGVRVAIQAVVGDIAGRAHEPFRPGIVPFEHPVPG
jgi:hypothetical protein